MTGPVLFYDGDCHFCDRTVAFILRHERGAEFRFATLQSASARQMLAPQGVAADDLSSMLVWVEGEGRLFRESDALVQVLKRLRGPWRWLQAIGLVPRPVRDAAYRFVGARRHRWWGRRTDQCVLPTPEVRDRFLA